MTPAANRFQFIGVDVTICVPPGLDLWKELTAFSFSRNERIGSSRNAPNPISASFQRVLKRVHDRSLQARLTRSPKLYRIVVEFSCEESTGWIENGAFDETLRTLTFTKELCQFYTEG